MLSIEYPTDFMRPISSVWYDYWLDGFRQVPNVSVSCTTHCDKCSIDRIGSQMWYIELKHSDCAHSAWLDWCDFETLHRTLIRPYDHCFKIMLRRNEAGQNIHPLGQTVSRMQYFDMLAAVRTEKERHDYKWDVLCIGRATNYALRMSAVQRISSMGLRTLVGLSPYPRRPQIPKEYQANLLPYQDYLMAMAQSKIVVALPGVGGDWTWRHTEALGIGACVLTLAPLDAAPGDSAAWIECDREMVQLEELIHRHLKDDEAREAIAFNGRQYFDKYLAPAAAAKRIIDMVLKE